jgi:Peptidase family M1 domain/TPR repeat
MQNMNTRLFQLSQIILATCFLSLAAFAQTQRTPFDVTNYKIDVQTGTSNQLKAVADVTFTPLEDTRTVSFELNGSLKIESIVKVSQGNMAMVSTTPTPNPAMPKGKPTPKPAATPKSEVTFIQDQVGVGDLGPSVKIDLGEMIAKGTSITLRFKYAGALVTPEGGPLLTKRLAFVGDNFGYLMYASRWFPFHDYAADRSTSDITLNVPAGLQVFGYSDVVGANVGGKYRFVQSKPGLIGNFAFGKYTNKTLRFGDYELQFVTKIGDDSSISSYGEIVGRAMDYYTKQFGTPDCGKKLIIAQIDDESLEFYSAPGMIFMAGRLFERGRETTEARLQREVAYQWWGQTVGLKSFDDAWLSQGLAEYSSFSLRESTFKEAALDDLNREILEKSLTFEQTASLVRAPATLDDQSTAYQYIMYGKGALVYRLLRETLGKEKFNQLLRSFLEQYRNKNASVDDFEKLTTQTAGNNMRYFFARWVESTGVPEFTVDYQIIRTRGGKFITRGTVRQNYDNLRLPVELKLRAEGENETKTIVVNIEDASEDFNLESNGKPIEVIIDPNFKMLRISEDLRISAIARRGIELFKDGNFAEAQTQFEQALKLDRNNSWVYYHLGLIYLDQRNYDVAIDNFKATLNGNLSPRWLEIWANLKMGNAYDAKGDRTRAVAAYKRAEAAGESYNNSDELIKKYMAVAYDPKEVK